MTEQHPVSIGITAPGHLMTTTFIEPIDATLVCAHPPSAPALASKRLYRLKAGERIGPYSFREIAQYIGATRFAPDEMIWHER
ncbi:MAG TPA: hypothetical protein VM406_05975, partial [Noviherbaspirillum sp.]|nr:hypothetical protein [Noviherbaspirillum sp.]